MADTAQVSQTAATGTTGTNGTGVSINGGGTSTPGTTGQPASTGAQGFTYGGKTYGSADELGKAYEAAQSELGKWTQKHGDLEKRYQETEGRAKQWDQWWQTIQPLWGDDVEKFLLDKRSGGQRPNPQQVAQQRQMQQAAMSQAEQNLRHTFEQMAELPAAEQWGRFRQMLGGEFGQAMQHALQQQAQAFQQHLAQREDWYQRYLNNHLGLMRRALEQKITDPNFDVDATMEQAVRALGGQVDPLQLGQQLLQAAQSNSRMEEAKKAAYEQAKKDFELEQQNKRMETVAPASAPPVFRVPETRTGRGLGLGSLRQRAADNIAKQFGAGVFSEER